MNIALSAEDRDFAAELRRFFLAEVPGEIRQRVRDGEEIRRKDLTVTQRLLNKHGLAVPQWPAEWGGRGWTPMQRHLWADELALAHVPPPVAANTAMVGPVIAAFGSEELKRRFLPPTANLDIMWAQGFSEPEAGSDLASLKTRAVRDGNDYIVTGQKTWTTMAQDSDWIFCLVRTDPTVRPQAGISFLLLDLASPGVTVRPIQLIDGSYEVNEVFLDDVRVSRSQLVGQENHGWDYARFLLGNERTNVAGVGMIKAWIIGIKELIDGSGIDPVLRARLTQLEVETMALEMSVLRLLTRTERPAPADARPKADPLASLLKIRGSEIQQRLTELVLEVVGPVAVADRRSSPPSAGFAPLAPGSVHAMAHYLNWRKTSIFSGSNEIQRNIIAKSLLASWAGEASVTLERSAEQQLLAESVNALLDKRYDHLARLTLLRSGRSCDNEIWREYAELGLLGIAIDIEYGAARWGRRNWLWWPSPSAVP